MSKKINVHIYPTHFLNETRLLNITQTLSAAHVFNKIYILAKHRPDLPNREVLDATRELVRFPVVSAKMATNGLAKAAANIEWSARIICFLLDKPVDCINCHSLPMLPACVFLKLLKRSKLVYDTHELETETGTLSGLRKKIFKWVEAVFIRFADVVVVVNDSISDWYKKRYNLSRVYAVRNLPRRTILSASPGNILKNQFHIKEQEILYIYQGGLFEGRGIRMILNAFSAADSDKHVVFMGFGALENIVKEYQQSFSNIHFFPAVKPEDISRHTRGADVGICLIEKICLSYYYSLPNKLFEYLTCGLPVIASDFPEMEKVINADSCGWNIQVTEKALSDLITKITRQDILEKKHNIGDIGSAYAWENEEGKILQIYREIGFSFNS